MKPTNNKRLSYEGAEYRFNNAVFKKLSRAYAEKCNLKTGELIREIAAKGNYTEDAVKNWFYDRNGVADIDTVKCIADIIKLDDFRVLLMKITEEQRMGSDYTELKIISSKRIYDAIIDFLDDFYNTMGFNDLWIKYKGAGMSDPEEGIISYIEKRISELNLLLSKEYFYLHDTDMYTDLIEFVNGVETDDEIGWKWEGSLAETYMNKTSYAYRFECEGPTVEEDYEKALKRLNEIMIDRL